MYGLISLPSTSISDYMFTLLARANMCRKMIEHYLLMIIVVVVRIFNLGIKFSERYRLHVCVFGKCMIEHVC